MHCCTVSSGAGIEDHRSKLGRPGVRVNVEAMCFGLGVVFDPPAAKEAREKKESSSFTSRTGHHEDCMNSSGLANYPVVVGTPVVSEAFVGGLWRVFSGHRLVTGHRFGRSQGVVWWIGLVDRYRTAPTPPNPPAGRLLGLAFIFIGRLIISAVGSGVLGHCGPIPF